MIIESANPAEDNFAAAFIPHIGWLRHDPGEEVVSQLRLGYFEAAEQAFYWLYLRPGDTFIDCGAHIGLFSLTASRATGGAARIIAVEANEVTAGHLEYNLQMNGVRDARIIRAAVWKESGYIHFLEEGEGRAAFAHAAFREGAGGKRVPSVTMDQIVKDAGAEEIALVKMDVEGAEPEALSGARHAIDLHKLPVLMVECTEQNLQRRGLTTQDLISQLHSLGYTVCELSPEQIELVPFSPAGPIEFKNLFACRDVQNVNARLRSAARSNKTIARDILDRAAVCSRTITELKEWAEKAQEQVVREQEHTQQMRQWGERLEQTNRELKEWAEKAQAQVAREQELARQLLQRAEQSEQALAETNERMVRLEKEIISLRVFAARFGWLSRLFLRPKQ